MSGKIYTLMPAANAADLLAAAQVGISIALCGLLIWAILRRPAEG